MVALVVAVALRGSFHRHRAGYEAAWWRPLVTAPPLDRAPLAGRRLRQARLEGVRGAESESDGSRTHPSESDSARHRRGRWFCSPALADDVQTVLTKHARVHVTNCWTDDRNLEDCWPRAQAIPALC